MKKRITHLHRGQLLKDAANASRLKKEEIAGKAGYQRTSYYKHIREPELSYYILAAYGKALKYDFTEFLPDMPKYMIEEPDAHYSHELTLDEARKQVDYWKGKYIDLLERFNKLIEELRTNK